MLRRLLPIVVILLAVGGFMALKASRPAPPPVESRERIWRVETTTAEPRTARPTLVLYGRIEAPDRVRAASPVGGRIQSVAVRDGQRVDAGTLLARLDPSDLAPRVARARADVERETIRHQTDRKAIAEERALLELTERAATAALEEARYDVATGNDKRASKRLAKLLEEFPETAAADEARAGC